MPKIVYVEHDGHEHALEVPCGVTVMEGAVNNGIPGIDADCGGVCSCATCHVYVDPAWDDVLPEKSELEQEMLAFAAERRPTSRLSCRLTVGDHLDGLVVRMPASQF